MADYTIYNYESLRKRFTKMSTEEIMYEFAYVVEERNKLPNLGLSSAFFERSEPLDEAIDFLGGYLACLYCVEHGVDIGN